MKFSIVKSANKTYLQFSEMQVDEDGEVLQDKRGFVELSKPENAPKILADYQEGRKARTFGAVNRQGLYTMNVVAPTSQEVAEGELVTDSAAE